MIHMKCQVLFSLKNNNKKKSKCRLLSFCFIYCSKGQGIWLFRVNTAFMVIHGSYLKSFDYFVSYTIYNVRGTARCHPVSFQNWIPAIQNSICLTKHLTHCRLNRLSHTIYWKSPISIFWYVRLWDLHIPREKWLNYLQTVETLIRRRILRPLIWVCTVCQLPFYGSPDCNGLTNIHDE